MPRARAQEAGHDDGPVNPQAYRYSVTAEVAGKVNGKPASKKFVLMIQAHPDPKEPKVVPVRNGDYQINVIRGRFWVVPEPIITALRDAKGDAIDDQGRTVGITNSYPYQFFPYDGDLPVKSEVDEMGQPVSQNEVIYN